jgi:hypothetical protein
MNAPLIRPRVLSPKVACLVAALNWGNNITLVIRCLILGCVNIGAGSGNTTFLEVRFCTSLADVILPYLIFNAYYSLIARLCSWVPIQLLR